MVDCFLFCLFVNVFFPFYGRNNMIWMEWQTNGMRCYCSLHSKRKKSKNHMKCWANTTVFCRLFHLIHLEKNIYFVFEPVSSVGKRKTDKDMLQLKQMKKRKKSENSINKRKILIILLDASHIWCENGTSTVPVSQRKEKEQEPQRQKTIELDQKSLYLAQNKNVWENIF